MFNLSFQAYEIHMFLIQSINSIITMHMNCKMLSMIFQKLQGNYYLRVLVFKTVYLSCQKHDAQRTSPFERLACDIWCKRDLMIYDWKSN